MSYSTPPTSRRNPLPIIIAAVIGVVAIVVTYIVLKSGGDDAQPGARKHRDGCVALDVNSSVEKAGLLGQIADAYNGAGRTVGGKCVDVTISSTASGAAAEALARGWDPAREGAPAPQVWSPASSSWLALSRQQSGSGDKGVVVPTGPQPSIAQSPLVLAMPKPMAEALGWPGKQLGWSDVLGLTSAGWGSVGHPEWGSFKLGKTNPHFSTSGLQATIGVYFAATGLSSDLSEAQVTDPKVLDYVSKVESGVVHYGDTSLTFLANMAEADKQGRGLAYISAVAIEEKSVFDYNQGNPTGDPKLVGKGTKPRVPLVAIYPKEGTLLSDSPFVTLTTASEEQKAGAADFLAFVKEPAQQKRFTDLAFRSSEGKAGSVISQDNGMLPQAKVGLLTPPSPQVLARMVSGWDALRKRAQVLLVLDVSGSMAETAAGGKSRLELAKDSALKSLELFSPDDTVGLWTFSTERGTATTPYTERVPIGKVSDVKAQLQEQIRALSPEGGTALYATARAAQKKLLSVADPRRINAVVLLTDGKNEYPKDDNLPQLVTDLDASKMEESVRVFTIAFGEQADLSALQSISRASRAAAYDARDAATIDKVMVNVISNF
ncbi:substrate-binding domain-containing protein [Longispora fulva]|uniref:Ca-activated chloride channel family protein n=1 Tax=Longispora fulva TaxID=619741 RepID=A0A8J7GCM4_9ACTN|nr:substrate-binding domain-containing protein [Longispora fulva]MBG6138108.1 Ca-activated chloride channel family protein [Longispora fulva]